MRGSRNGFRIPRLIRLHDNHEAYHRQQTHQSLSCLLLRGVHGTKMVATTGLLFPLNTDYARCYCLGQAYSMLPRSVLALGASLDFNIAKEWDRTAEIEWSRRCFSEGLSY